ncbi:pyridoxamine 5'-phosphate oxidase family protein [Streptomyces sp. DSM 42041]|uniref:Pyridoxamine 5'-phosphate oxidase family protein n=1 Tax=Streptomyces hazeniae TaxID=3075538 RepID=A0ABU2NYP6_9ACTN|nr:pyridoxamine 5'-phosphate oxidase family protein [Streptomyces sp. DSM 42041]MDT0382104.1 pyridoxamine 5'-phosphate oxidase family protein [Streptomyces sp. DSM 42041]
MALSREERERFLAEPHIGALAVESGEAGRAPLTVPIWYQYEPGGELWVLTGRDSRKHAAIAKAGRFSLMAERVDPSVRYVSVEGPVTATEPGTVAHLREMSARYLPAEVLEPYVEMASREHGEQVVIRMRPERWLSADMGEV